MACPSVKRLIDEAKRGVADGRNWCECVHKDIPKAEEALNAGRCSSARYYAVEALKRITGTKYDLRAAAGGGGGSSFDPVTAVEL